MSARSKRSTVQPASYKEFNERGRAMIPEGLGVDQRQLMEQNNSDESKDSRDFSSGESQFDELSAELDLETTKRSRSRSQSISDVSRLDSEHRSYDSTEVDSPTIRFRFKQKQTRQSGGRVEGHTPARKLRRHDKSDKHDKHINTNAGTDMLASTNTGSAAGSGGNKGQEDYIALGINPEDDDLDLDEQGKKNKYKSRNKKSPVKHTCDSSKAGSPEKSAKKRVSVAKRLTGLPAPSFSRTPPLVNDYNFITENEKADREMEIARQQLLQSQREAQLAKKRREAEETKRKTLLLQKQTEKDNKKAAQERARYEKDASNKNRVIKTKATSNQWGLQEQNSNMAVDPVLAINDNGANNANIERAKNKDTVDNQVHSVKQKVRDLNPLRRARRLHVTTEGHNNPNVAGEDNGLNAWLDAELNKDEVDHELRIDAAYAKRNLDSNGFFDVDHIPIRGPPLIDNIPVNISFEHAAKIVSKLMNEDNLSICRSTGIMRTREDIQERMKHQKAESTARREQESTRNRQYPVRQGPGNYRSTRNERWSEERYEEHVGWDTDSDSDGIMDNEESLMIDGKKHKIHVVDRSSRDRGRYQMPSSRPAQKRYYNRRPESTVTATYVDTQRKQRCRETENRRKTNRGKKLYSDYDSSPESDTSPHRSGKVRSGISARPNSSVKVQQTYPHFSLGQVSGFIGQNLHFHSLSFEQFVAGEMVTITSACDPSEVDGRIHLLKSIALWKLRANVSWAQVRNTYAHIIRMIENQEITWEANWDHYERHIYDKIAPVQNKSEKTKKGGNTSNTEFTWFCKKFQTTDGCSKDAPHPDKIKGVIRQVHHICATCIGKEKIRKYHSENSAECPYKEM